MFKRETEIPSAEEIREHTPFPKSLSEIKRERDAAVSAVIRGEDDRMLVICGPCSAHNPDAVVEYAARLGRLNERVKDKLVLVLRVYTNKPRTRGTGYKGIFSQPDPTLAPDILKGIYALREMHIRAVEASGLTAADEMLYPENYAYVEDLLSYVAVGARSSENQMHRMVSSGIDLPVGIKNPMSGNVTTLLNSIYAAQAKQTFMYHHYQVTTSGNPLAHAILRGLVDNYDHAKPNFHYENVMEVVEGYRKSDLANPAIVIDANHSNSDKQFRQQIRIVEEVMQNRAYSADIRKYVKGFMIESFLEEGCQKTDEVFGKSITDPCLGWDDTERLLLDVAEKV